MSKRAVRLQDIEFIHAAVTPRLSLNAGFARAITLLMIATLFVIPGAIFSAALTPVQSQHDIARHISIPTFYTDNAGETVALPIGWPEELALLMNPPYFQGNLTTAIPGTTHSADYVAQWMSKQGVYTYDPAAKRAALINAASDASSNRLWQRVHAKLDDTGYFYADRSYGAGMAAGFAQLAPESQPKWYEYDEAGFHAQVSCHFNESTAFELGPIEGINGVSGAAPLQNISFAAYSTFGTQPDPDKTPVPRADYFSYKPHGILAWTSLYANQTSYGNDKAIYVSVRALAADKTSDDPVWNDAWGFRFFDKLQCRISFQAQNFHVRVNETSKIISVTPKSNSASFWPPYGDAVASEISWWLWAISAFDGCLGGSVLGRAMRLNQEQLRLLDSEDSPHESTIHAMEDFLADIVDNTLNLLASTRYVSAGHSTSVQAQITIPAIVLGSRIYATVTLIISILALLIYVSMATWTHLWRDMVELDLTNMTAVISSALRGGAASLPEIIASLTSGGATSELLVAIRGADRPDHAPIFKVSSIKDVGD